MRKPRNISFLIAESVLLALLAFSSPAAASNAETVSLDFPLDCIPNETCWIVKYVDLDPGNGRLDYRCGWLSSDGHKGVDIAIRDLGAMGDGVEVRAAAGRVQGTRDGMEDVNVRTSGGVAALKGKECGNGLVLRHSGGWETQYCHLRKGSLRVHTGEKVKAGQHLGYAGMSGAAEFPHLHLSVRKGNKIADPFTGRILNKDDTEQSCNMTATPLWSGKALAELA